MDVLLMVLLCLLASVGLAQCVIWVLERRKPPAGLRCGYLVIPLYDDPATLEAQLRYGVSCLGWARAGSPVVILVDMGMGAECNAMCEHFLREHPGLLRCDADTLPCILCTLDSVLHPGHTEIPA